MTIASAASWLPSGYALIQGATFAGETFGDFGFKQTPETNGEWGDWVRGLGEDRFVLMHHDRNTGATQILSRGRDVKAVLGEELSPKQKLNWDAGDILVSGSLVLFKLVENPSQVFNEVKGKKKRIFSGERQPALISFFESMAWCLLKTEASGGKLKYDAPTDAQYHYVASNNGTQEYGTSTGELETADGQKLAYLGEYQDGQGTTISVDDSRNSYAPMGVQVAGNVWRWTRFNAKEQLHYGLRGGSWYGYPDFGRAAFRGSFRPGARLGVAGFSPVVRQDSPF